MIETFQARCADGGARTPAGGDVSKQTGAYFQKQRHQADEAPTNHLSPDLRERDTRTHVRD